MNRFLFGLGLGITAGLLFAPARGEETRRDLRERLDESVNVGKRKFNEVLEEGSGKAGEIGHRAGKQAFDKLTQDIRPEPRRA